MEIILNKGGQKLYYAGYIYTKSTKKNSIQWERTQTKGLDCGGQSALIQLCRQFMCTQP